MVKIDMHKPILEFSHFEVMASERTAKPFRILKRDPKPDASRSSASNPRHEADAELLKVDRDALYQSVCWNRVVITHVYRHERRFLERILIKSRQWSRKFLHI